MYRVPQLSELTEYTNAWLEAQRQFDINCFSIIGCLTGSENRIMPENINPLDELEDLLDVKDAKVALIELEKKDAIPLDDFIRDLGL